MPKVTGRGVIKRGQMREQEGPKKEKHCRNFQDQTIMAP